MHNDVDELRNVTRIGKPGVHPTPYQRKTGLRDLRPAALESKRIDPPSPRIEKVIAIGAYFILVALLALALFPSFAAAVYALFPEVGK